MTEGDIVQRESQSDLQADVSGKKNKFRVVFRKLHLYRGLFSVLKSSMRPETTVSQDIPIEKLERYSTVKSY